MNNTPTPIDSLRALIADDSYAMSFQSMGQYRTALLKTIDAGPATPTTQCEADERAQKALAAITERLALTYRICCGTAPKQSVGELLDVTINMPEWEIIRAVLATPTAPQAATTASAVASQAADDEQASLERFAKDIRHHILHQAYTWLPAKHAKTMENMVGGMSLRAIVDAYAPVQAAQPALPAEPTDELLDMLGRIHPFAMTQEDRAKAYERLERAFVIQQPWPVPDQACIVWRADLMDMRYDLIHKQACFDSERSKRESANVAPGAAQTTDAREGDANV